MGCCANKELRTAENKIGHMIGTFADHIYDRKSYLTDIVNTRSSKHQTNDRHKYHLMKRKKFNFKSQVIVTSVRATCICMLCHYRQKYMLFQTSYKTINLMFYIVRVLLSITQT